MLKVSLVLVCRVTNAMNCFYNVSRHSLQTSTRWGIHITAAVKTNPRQPAQSMLNYPRAIQTDEVNLDNLTEQISMSTTLTETDCHAVIISLVNTVSKALNDSIVVRFGQLVTFQVSV